MHTHKHACTSAHTRAQMHTHTRTHTHARMHTHTHTDRFAVELTVECLKCSFRLTRGGPYLRGVIGSTVGAYPRGTGSNPVKGNGHFFPSYRQLYLSSFSDTHTHTHWAAAHVASTHNVMRAKGGSGIRWRCVVTDVNGNAVTNPDYKQHSTRTIRTGCRGGGGG